jgi:hypothetical protein
VRIIIIIVTIIIRQSSFTAAALQFDKLQRSYAIPEGGDFFGVLYTNPNGLMS